MADDEEIHDETGATVELARSDLREHGGRGRLPVPARDLREQLPGLEPERQLTDWGRSERVEGVVDRTLYEFLYRYWLRVEVEGIENVPLESGALILANHSGAIPQDGAMIAKAVREEHPRRRPVHLLTRQHFASVPGVGMLARKLGAVPDHPANLNRLLYDERQLVLAFPEGRTGARKPLKERYRLRDFLAEGLIATALQARSPIVPLAVLGAEESMPVFAALRGRLGLPYVPLVPPVPLPSKFRLRFLEPIRPDELDEDAWQSRTRIRALQSDIRALIAENLLELVASRRSVWLG